MFGKNIFLVLLLWFVGILAFGQGKSVNQPTSLETVFPKKDYAPKAKKKSKKSKTTYDARDNFYDRQEEQSKQRIKDDKKGSSPQYTDQKYFGHKRQPRKRPPEKMRFCKVCGIRH